MRSRTRPFRLRASRHTCIALTTCPRCRKPVGAGANRVIFTRMFQQKCRALALLSLAWALIGVSTDVAIVHGQSKPKAAEWTTYGGDLASTRYSPLDQINKENFSTLEVAWRFKTDSLGPRPEFNYQGTPLMVDGIVYTTAGTPRAVVARDAATGEMIWMHRAQE